MQSSEVYHLLVRCFRSSRILAPVLWYASVLTSLLVLIVPGGRPWAAAAFLASIFLYWNRDHGRKRQNIAVRISKDPQLVYWAHPTSGHQVFSDETMHDCRLMMLHLRDGTKCEVRLPPDQMRVFVSWLVEGNPSVRLGTYDKEDGDLQR